MQDEQVMFEAVNVNERKRKIFAQSYMNIRRP